jgi:NAD(P)H-hydrate repair Nnr-like enzyme with NAD(P)H-hydrate dehydratase domain
MDRTYWHKQTLDKPLFPDLLWSRPENKQQAGKLLIIGGNAHGFAAPAEAFMAAEKAGIGTSRAVLPDSLRKTVGQSFPAGEYAPSTPSGSFSQRALAELLDMAGWADGVVLAGDFGHNSETAILLEKFAQDYEGLLVLTRDAIDYFTSVSELILNRPRTLLVTEFAQLRKLAKNVRFTQPFTSDMDLLRLIDRLHDFTQEFAVGVVVEHSDNTAVAIDGQVSTTKARPTSLVSAAAGAGVWWLQNPGKPFEALTTSFIK